MDREVAVKEPGTGTILLDVTPGPGEEFERSFFIRNGHRVAHVAPTARG